MPRAKNEQDRISPATERLRFMADRMALLMVDLVRRDCDYGKFCYDDWYEDDVADYLRKSKEYDVCLDFVRRMLRRHDTKIREGSANGEDVTDTADAAGATQA